MAEVSNNKDKSYIHVLNLIAGISQNDSISGVQFAVSQISEDLKHKDAILIEMDKSRIFPDAFMNILTLLRFIQSEKEEINQHYEDSINRYETINKLTSRGRPTEDEAKIKKTLTDFILKIEFLYESHFKAEEGIIKELSRHMGEMNIKGGAINKELLSYKISSRSVGQIQPHIISLLDVYFQYKKNKGIMKRLVRIAGYIIEDAEKKL
jgi:competence protein ComGF